MATIHPHSVTLPSATPATFDPEGITDHAGALARFLSLEAGWTTADLGLFSGDPVFTAEVALVMATLEASR